MSRTAAANEPSRHRRALNILLIVLGVLGYESLVHWAVVSGKADGVGPMFALAPLLLLGCWLLLRQSAAGGTAVIFGIIGVVAVLRARGALPDLKLLYPAPYVVACLLLLWLFGRTLRAGREALVTRIARHVHGTLPPDIELYTRRVTWAWCIYFAVMATSSVALFAFAPLRVWSWFANVLNVPFILLMFAAEYIYRVLRFPNFSHASFLTAIRAARDLSRAVMQSR